MTEQVKVTWKPAIVMLQYKGSGDFLKTELPKLLQELLEIYLSGLGGMNTPEFSKVQDTETEENSSGRSI